MGRFNGSCLCGAVTYELEGEPLGFFHCHCSRCRKANGAGHSSNLRLAGASIKWLQGEGQISSYKVPEAERFRNDFCRCCGSPLPRLFPALDFAVVPAGTLDSEIPDMPASRIFCASRASWSCKDNLPEYDEYAPS